MSKHPIVRALPWALVMGSALPACGGDDLARPPGACESGLLVGDLVITEIMADPPGADSGREWFEIYNASATEFDLRGLVLLHSREDSTDANVHEIGRSLTLGPDDYAVVGGLLDDEDVLAVVPYIDYGYGGDLGDMRNSAGRLVVACGDEIIDEALYNDPTPNHSRSFTGDRAPDANANDDLSLWCDSSSEIDAEGFGTPGASNDICVGTGGPVSCIDNGVLREARAPEAGDLVITEVLSDPAAAEDDSAEWFEVRVNADIDLNGLAIGKQSSFEDAEPVTGNDCVPALAGTRLVFARSADSELNGGLPNVDIEFGFSLNQSDNQVVLSYGNLLVDTFPYGSSSPGVAHNLDPDFENTDDNDDERYHCDATSTYGAGDFGTPGAPNTECEIPPPEGQCLDGESFRDIVRPQPGDLLVTEIMANPEAAGEESESEWFELRATADFDLNGLELGTEEGKPRDVVEATECLSMGAGDHVVVARETDPAINGGLPVVDATFGFALTNSNGALWIGSGGTTLDLVTWASVPAGASRSLDASITDPGANDPDEVWCEGLEPFGDGDLGTPGAENPVCGGIPTGTCLDGGRERDLVRPAVGELVITELMPNPAAVNDSEGEWFELLATANVDLNGLRFGDDPADAPSRDNSLPAGGDCISVSAGERVILARNADTMANGGLPEVVGTFSFGLVNGGGALFVGMGDEVIDDITWTGSAAGVALTLDPMAEDAVSNDDPANFCAATEPYGDGDLGSPGAQGAACGGGGGGDGMCDDGGMPRAIVAPTVGDLVITEVMPNPSAVADSSGEWFEVLVTADVDLNGLEFGDTPGAPDGTLASGGACIAVTTGQRLVFARNADAMANGGLPAVDQTFSFDLVNGGDDLFVGVDGMVLDQISWSSSSAGTSISLDPAAEDVVANDDAANFCAGVDPYGDGDLGTPGSVNPAC